MRRLRPALAVADPWAVTFLGLVAALSAPFWLLGALWDLQVLPGAPLSAGMAFTPAAAALMLRGRAPAPQPVPARPIRRSAAAALIAAVILPVAVNAGAMALQGLPPMDPAATWARAAGLAVLLIAAALGEELGWTGYALPRLSARLGLVPASVTLGLIWWAWHLIPFLQAGQATPWLLWKGLAMVAARVIVGWLWARGGRILAIAVAFHAADNISLYLTPAAGGHFDPMRTGLLLCAALALIAVVELGRAAATSRRSR